MRAFLLLLVAFVPALAFGGAPPKLATVSVESCTLRSAASPAAAAVTTAKRGTVLQVETVEGAWIKVKTEAGESGFVQKTDLVPGKKTLAELPPLPGATPAVASASPTPKAAKPVATPAPVATATPAPAIAAAPDRGGAREERTGLALRGGPVVASSSYQLGADRASTRYLGIAADVDYWLLESAGAHVRVASARGSTSTRVSESTSVSGMAAELREIQLDLLGRYVIGSSPASPSVVGALGFHSHEVVVEEVKVEGASVGPVSTAYRGGVVGLGGELPLGTPSTGLHARLEYWLAPSLTEPHHASGTSDGASGMGAVIGGYSRVTDSIRVEAAVEFQSFDGRFKGDGVRFGEPVHDAHATDRYTVFTLGGAYRF